MISLPSETAGQVLRKLSVVDRLQCERVNRRLKAIVLELGWTEQRKLSEEIVFEGVVRRSQKKKTNKGKKRFNIKKLVALFRRVGANLVELDLESFSAQPFTGIFGWFHLLPNLAKLDILGQYNFCEAVGFLPPTLIELHSSGPFDDQSLAALSEKCPNLEAIHFYADLYPKKKVSVSAMNTFLGKYPSMKTLYLKGDFIRIKANVSLTALGELHQLEELYLKGVTAFDDAALTAVATGCPRLRHLSIHGIRVSEEAIQKLEQHPNLLDMELKHLLGSNANFVMVVNEQWKKKKYKTLGSRMAIEQSIFHEALKEIISVRKNSCSGPSPIADLIRGDFLPFLIKCLDSTNDVLQLEAVLALANITNACSLEQKRDIVQAGILQNLMELIDSDNMKISEKSLRALGDIIAVEFRDQCIELGLVEHALKILGNKNALAIGVLREVSHVFESISSFSKQSSPLPMDIIEMILPALEELIQKDDSKILYNTARALSHIADFGIEQIQHVIDLGIVQRLIHLLAHPDEDVQWAALNAVRYLTKGTDEQIQLVLNLGALEMLPPMLSHQNDRIVKAALFLLSNIAEDSEKLVQAVIATELVPVIIHILVRGAEPEKFYAAQTIFNIAENGNSHHALYLVHHGAISPLLNLLEESDDTEIVHSALCAIKNILEKSGDRKAEICQRIIGFGGLDKIKNVPNYESERVNLGSQDLEEDIKKISSEIIEKFFSPNKR